jgi:hypothetical protein
MRPVTFDEVASAAKARVGQRVSVRIEMQGEVDRTFRGILAPGQLDTLEATPDEYGRFAFRLARGAAGFVLDPRLVTCGQERPDRRELRVEMHGGVAIVIETLGPTPSELAKMAAKG